MCALRLRSSRPTKSRISRRLAVEALEGREVPATFTVTTFADVVSATDGKLSLREAISRANANPGADAILLRAGTYTQTLAGDDNTNAGGDFDVTGSLTITGAGPAATVIKGNHNDRLFDVIGSVNVTFNNLSLRDAGSAVSNGGAVQALSANINLNNCHVRGAVGALGGAINAEGGSVTIRNSRLVNNRGDLGGAVRVGTGNLLLDHSAVIGNVANRGGGIFAQTGNVTLTQSTVRANTALVSGGGINVESGKATLSNSQVLNNLAVGNGGGIFAATASLTGGTVSGNRSTQGSGGGIASTAVTLTNSTVNGNAAHADGGGVFLGVGDATLTGSTVAGNSAGTRGGGIHAETGAVTLTGSTVKNNVATNSGGGISTLSATLTGSTVSGNQSGGAGGGISTGMITLTNSTVSDNTAASLGGGILAGLRSTLVGSTVSGNTAGGQGGGIFSSTTNLTNCTISGNTSGAARIVGGGDGGGVFAQHGTFLNSTIVENRAIGVADFGGAGVASQFGVTDPIRLKNTIIAQNFDSDFQEHDVIGLFASDGNNLIGVRGGDAGGFDEARDLLGTADAPIDPVLGDLANNGGPTKTHALLAGSPAIDAGNNVGAPATDQRGRPRIKDGNGDGRAVVDIGAFER